MPALLSRSCIVCVILLVAAGSAVTPVEKVVELLKKLEAQIGEEGKKEAAQYDKYACFCKEQADNKLYAIEKSQDTIKELSAQIGKLTADIADLNGDIADLSTRVTELEGEIKTAVASRATEHEGYLVEEKDLADGIVAIVGAIKSLKDSKEEMSNAKLDLSQVRSLARRTLNSIDKLPAVVRPSAAQLRADLQAIIMEPVAEPAATGTTQKQYAAKASYEYHSNDIIATLQGLLKTFKQNKKELDETEFQLQASHDKKVLGLSNEKNFAEKDKAEKEEVVAQKTDDMHSAQEDKDAETKAKDADQEFLNELTEGCQTKAEGWDSRSKTRAAELTSIAEAMEVLKSGVAPNYSANKKLVGIEKAGKVQHAVKLSVQRPQKKQATLAKKVAGEVSFLQLRDETNQSAPQRMLQFLEGEAKRLKSSVLSSLTTKVDVEAGADHFVKVRGIIKALIDRLEADALSEADQKTFCDKSMKAAISGRDSASLAMEEHEATISQKEAERQEVLADIQVLLEQVAELNKALNEAMQLRATEKAVNEKTLADAGAGKDAVTLALSILKGFYDGSAFVQGKYVPPNADREGMTVSDRAPEIYEGDYRGKQEASSGILGLLNVILSDFERTEQVVGDAETEAQSDFETFESDTKQDIAAKEKEKGLKESQVATLEDEITTAKDNLIDAKKAHADSLTELEKLKAMCVAGEENWEERKEKREQEVEALKQALQILNDWKN